MKPIIILPPNVMSEENIKLLRDNDLCVVVAEDPAKVKFIDPIPAITSRTQMENAAIQLSRLLLNGGWSGASLLGKSDFASLYVELLVKGSPLCKGPTKEEMEREIFDDTKADELRRLAREEAKAERAAAKQAKAAKK